MTTKHDLQDWVLQAIQHHGGRAGIVDVAKHIGRRTSASCEPLVTCFTPGSTTCDGQPMRCEALGSYVAPKCLPKVCGSSREL